MKYKVVFKDGRDPIKDLTIDEALQYRMNNIAQDGEFTVTEQTRPAKEKKDKSEEFKEAKDLYLASLKQYQRDEIIAGTRKLCHTEELGFYLKVATKDPQFFSKTLQDSNEKEAAIKLIKNNILNNSGNILEAVLEQLPERYATEDEFELLLKEILK